MSDLRYRTTDELRAVIRDTTAYRDRLSSEWQADEAEIERLKQRVARKRKTWHDLGQRETWARLYLARKELGGEVAHGS